MSRAFTKDEAPEAPLVVPPRAPLPEGVPNYVTPSGLAALRAERAALEAERSRLDAQDQTDDAVRRQRRLVAGTLAALLARLATARVVDPARQAPDVVRFGATVTVQGADGERTVRLVGVDEAAASDGAEPVAVAFTSPIARALIGTREGDAVTLATPRGEERLTVQRVRYAG